MKNRKKLKKLKNFEKKIAETMSSHFLRHDYLVLLPIMLTNIFTKF